MRVTVLFSSCRYRGQQRLSWEACRFLEFPSQHVIRLPPSYSGLLGQTLDPFDSAAVLTFAARCGTFLACSDLCGANFSVPLDSQQESNQRQVLDISADLVSLTPILCPSTLNPRSQHTHTHTHTHATWFPVRMKCTDLIFSIFQT